MSPYDANTAWILIRGKCFNPFIDPPATLSPKLTTGSAKDEGWFI